EIEAGGQVHTIEYKKEEPINFNHMIFNPVHVNRELSVDIGLALEGMASINLDIRYYSHLCISNSTENKSVRAFVPTYEKPVEVQGYKKILLELPCKVQGVQ